MMTYTMEHLYAFYLIIILALSIITYIKTEQLDHKIEYSMYAACIGAVISIFLWSKYGKNMILY